MMKAFIVDRYGSTDGVRAGEMPAPQLREDDVLIQIHAAGVNLLDAKIRDGAFKRILPYRLPLILGNDVAGVVVRVGYECGDSSLATSSMRGQMNVVAETIVQAARNHSPRLSYPPARPRDGPHSHGALRLGP